MKKKMKLIFVAISTCLMMIGCVTETNKMKLSIEVPSCIYFNGKIYWETEKVGDAKTAKYLAEVKQSENDNILPNENYVISSTGKKLVHNKIYKKDDFLYIEADNYFYQFAYYDHMELAKEDTEIVKEEQKNSEEIPVPNAIRPHFVYNGMRYLSLGNEADEDDLKFFKKVGAIKAVVHLASKDFSSNLYVGDLLYASENQNRYMIVKSLSNDRYYFYENEAYFKE